MNETARDPSTNNAPQTPASEQRPEEIEPGCTAEAVDAGCYVGPV
jgi:hypothetical protein